MNVIVDKSKSFALAIIETTGKKNAKHRKISPLK